MATNPKTRIFVEGSEHFNGRWFTFEREAHTELEGTTVTTIRATYKHGIYGCDEHVVVTLIGTENAECVAIIDGRHQELEDLGEFGIALDEAWRELA